MSIAVITRWVRGGRGVPGASVPCALLFAMGCAELLGIDGDYVGANANAALSSAGAGPDATGGVSTGGDAGAGGAGAALEACTAGRYEGQLVGHHRVSLLALLPVQPPQGVTLKGTVSFTLVPDSTGTSAVVDGAMTAPLDPPLVGTFIVFRGKLKGTVGCAAGALSGTIVGSYGVPAPPGTPDTGIPFSGNLGGSFKNDKFSGSWSETEDANQAFGGDADWDAARTGP